MIPKQFPIVNQIDGESPESAKTYLGMLDTTYLFSYAFFMFFSGWQSSPRYQYLLLLSNWAMYPWGLWQNGWICATSWAWGWYSGVIESPLDIKSLYNHQIKNIEWYFNICQHFPVEFLLGCLVSPTLLAYIAFGISLLCRFESFFRQNCSSRKTFWKLFVRLSLDASKPQGGLE